MPVITIPWIENDAPFPSVELALSNGLVAAGADLSPERLLNAYSQGLFPWYNPGEPILWWSPNPRTILLCDQFKLSKSLAKKERQIARQELGSDASTRITTNTAFLQVIAQCAKTRLHKEGTWISPEVMEAYYRLHRLGQAHSIEVWHHNELVAGLYGVQLGLFFFGESMFSTMTDMSKIALLYLTRFLPRLGIKHIDCQQETKHLMSLGANTLPRTEFTQLLVRLGSKNSPPWGYGQLCHQGLLHPLAPSFIP